jgi:hypothetical protein
MADKPLKKILSRVNWLVVYGIFLASVLFPLAWMSGASSGHQDVKKVDKNLEFNAKLAKGIIDNGKGAPWTYSVLRNNTVDTELYRQLIQKGPTSEQPKPSAD